MQEFLHHYYQWVSFAIMLFGIYMMIICPNMVKKLIGLGVFQTAILLFFIALADSNIGLAPILADNKISYANPLPHVLMLTAIVVGVATLAVGLALTVRIKETYDTIEDNDIN